MATQELRELSRADIGPLDGSFAGELVLPGEEGYEQRRSIWNRMIDRRPALFARCASTEDARRALAFARERGLPVSIMGGGHNVSGSALVDDGVVIDHGLRRGVELSADQSRVSVEPGALLGDLDAVTVPRGVAVPIGINTTTGLAGLTLGGGIGWLMRAHGLTCDRLVGAEVLLADGRLVDVDEATDADLLWALRGGGGNFGIVTRFDFATVPMPPAVLAGMIAFPMEDGARILRTYRDWAAASPDTLTTIVALRTVLPLPVLPAETHGRRMVGVGVCFVGDPADDDALLAPLRALGTPLYDSIARKPFTTHQSMFDASVPPRNGYYWKSHYLAALTDETIEAAVDHHLRAPQPWSYSLMGQLGGAIAGVANDATAYPHREAPYIININGVDDDPALDDEVIAWTRETFDALAPFSTGGVYVNFVGNEGDERVRAAYGPAYQRLARIKARYDPDNVFSTNQNVRPAATPAG
ncbi:MAG TPA: FAD-binding oxidoreductase [Candidatus Limnocylindria bacterium]|nr:FAD-binding oxidoreductase [Candidatus Limnocylindria bacterium]